MSSLERRREENILRNKEFLDKLFVEDNNNLLLCPRPKQRKLEVEKPYVKILSPGNLTFIHLQISELYPCRERETHSILNFLSNDIFPTPTLLITGLEGVGKTSIALKCVSQTCQLYCVLDLGWYSKLDQFLHDAWVRIIIAVKGTASINKIKRDVINNVFGINTPPTSLADLQSLVVDLLESLEDKSSSIEITESNNSTACLHIVFDQAEHASRLHTDLMPWILRFDQGDGRRKLGASSRSFRIKVLVISREIGLTVCSGPTVLHLPFRSYALPETEKIVVTMAKQGLSSESLCTLEEEHWRGFRSLVRETMGNMLTTANPATVLWFVCRSSARLLRLSPAFGELVRAESPRAAVGTAKGGSVNSSTATATVAKVSFAAAEVDEEWTADMPPAQKIWLLAAYVAAHVRADADKFALGHVRKARRKSVQTAAASTEDSGDKTDSTHTVSLERLVSVGTVVARQCGELVGDTLLKSQLTRSLNHANALALVESCVASGLLARAGSGSSLTQRLVCLITKNMATKLAKSVGFPIGDYVH